MHLSSALADPAKITGEDASASEESDEMAFVKKNPWVVVVGLFAILIAVGIATT